MLTFPLDKPKTKPRGGFQATESIQWHGDGVHQSIVGIVIVRNSEYRNQQTLMLKQ